MVRPKDASSEETWHRIVSAASEELIETERGELDVSVRRVASRAGVSSGTISYYFPTKEGLLEACLDAYYARLRALVMELGEVKAWKEPRPAVEHAARRLYRFAVAERRSLSLRAKINVNLGQLDPLRARHVRGPMLDGFASMIGALGGLGDAEGRLTLQTMTGLIMHLALLSDLDLEQIAGVGGEAGRRILEDHVARVAVRLVFPS